MMCTCLNLIDTKEEKNKSDKRKREQKIRKRKQNTLDSVDSYKISLEQRFFLCGKFRNRLKKE